MLRSTCIKRSCRKLCEKYQAHPCDTFGASRAMACSGVTLDGDASLATLASFRSFVLRKQARSRPLRCCELTAAEARTLNPCMEQPQPQQHIALDAEASCSQGCARKHAAPDTACSTKHVAPDKHHHGARLPLPGQLAVQQPPVQCAHGVARHAERSRPLVPLEVVAENPCQHARRPTQHPSLFGDEHEVGTNACLLFD